MQKNLFEWFFILYVTQISLIVLMDQPVQL